MSIDEAIETIQLAIAQVEWEYPLDYAAAFDVALEALKKQKELAEYSGHSICTWDEDYGYDGIDEYNISEYRFVANVDDFLIEEVKEVENYERRCN